MSILTHIPVLKRYSIIYLFLHYSFAKTRDMILPLLDVISLDSEPILRTCLASQLSGLAEVCANAAKEGTSSCSPRSVDSNPDESPHADDDDGYSIAEEGYQAICEVILPVLNRLLSDKDPTVRSTASTYLFWC